MNSILDQRVKRIRHFNRFYTLRIGVLNDKFLRSPYSLTEGRVLFEIYCTPNSTATAIAKQLAIDSGYLSRTLASFQNRRLIKRSVSRSDARQALLNLTPKGKKVVVILNTRARNEISAMLRPLPATAQSQLINADSWKSARCLHASDVHLPCPRPAIRDQHGAGRSRAAGRW